MYFSLPASGMFEPLEEPCSPRDCTEMSNPEWMECLVSRKRRAQSPPRSSSLIYGFHEPIIPGSVERCLHHPSGLLATPHESGPPEVSYRGFYLMMVEFLLR